MADTPGAKSPLHDNSDLALATEEEVVFDELTVLQADENEETGAGERAELHEDDSSPADDDDPSIFAAIHHGNKSSEADVLTGLVNAGGTGFSQATDAAVPLAGGESSEEGEEDIVGANGTAPQNDPQDAEQEGLVEQQESSDYVGRADDAEASSGSASGSFDGDGMPHVPEAKNVSEASSENVENVEGENGSEVSSFGLDTPEGNEQVNVSEEAANIAPESEDSSATITEDTAFSGSVIASDADGGDLVFALSSGPTNGSLTFNADGTYSYSPDTDYNGDDSFTYEVSDGQGGSVTATVSLTVDPTNDDPVSANSSLGGSEDSTFSGSVTASDVDGDSLSFALDDGPDHGSLVFAADGSYTYTPDADYNGADSFTYQVSDGEGGTTTATVSLTVDPANDDPVSADSVGTTNEDAAYSSSVSGSDVDGDSLTYALDSGPSNGALSFNADGSYTYTPNADYNGSDSFTYEVSDGEGGTTTATVSLTIDPTNDDPVAEDSSGYLAEDTAFSSSVTASDVDGDSLSYALDSGPENGSLSFNADGTYTYTPDADFYGSDSFTYQVSDGQGGTDTATVNLDISDVVEEVNFDDQGMSSNDKLSGESSGKGKNAVHEDDTLFGGEGNDKLDGKGANDELYGGSGDDQVKGGDGDDLLYGGDGDDTMEGGSDSDMLFGNDGNDVMYGDGKKGGKDAGDDTLDGGTGDDTIYGGSGDDEITGSAGDDWLFGDAGDDLFIWDTRDGNDNMSGGSGWDTIALGKAEGETTGGDNGWTVTLDDGTEYQIDPTADGDAYIDIANDSSGTIVDDTTGETISFEGIERIEF